MDKTDFNKVQFAVALNFMMKKFSCGNDWYCGNYWFKQVWQIVHVLFFVLC